MYCTEADQLLLTKVDQTILSHFQILVPVYDPRFLDGDGSFSARMTAFPSDDIAIRNEFRPFGGDGVISSSFRTMASPSNNIDNL
ncbi:hypothetical protein N7528_005155 [Penicillium herquei]|nr:hypothetical protein N7528_005155 [Penicillium herquei]